MKCIILAGGWGSRLGQLTQSIPKPMIEIGGKPVIWHIMKYYSYFGFNSFVIALGVKGDVIKKYFANYDYINNDLRIDFSEKNFTLYNQSSNENWKIDLIDTGLNTLKGGRIKRVEKYLNNEINMITYGDGLCNVDLNELVKFHKSHGKTVTITGVHPPARFGEIIEKDGKVISFEEKPQTSIGLINGGFMVFNKNMLNYLSIDEDCDFEFGALEKLSKIGEVMVFKHQGSWECMDHERDAVHLNSLWYNNQAFWKKW